MRIARVPMLVERERENTKLPYITKATMIQFMNKGDSLKY
jgi:hypothetical protein